MWVWVYTPHRNHLKLGTVVVRDTMILGSKGHGSGLGLGLGGRRRLASPDSAHYLLVQLLMSMLSSISPSPLHRHTSGVEARPFCVMLLGFRYRMPSTCTESVWRIADVLRVVRGVKPFSNGLWRSLIRDNGVIEYCHAQPIDLNDYVGLTGKVII